MTFSTWRGVIGNVKPNVSAGLTEDLIRLLPDGVGLIPIYLNLPQDRTPARLEAGRIGYEESVKALAEQDVALIQLEGSALFMMPGPKGEREIIDAWDKKYRTTVITQGMSLTAAMKAMKMKNIIAIRPFTWKTGNDFTATYLTQAGFDVLTIANPAGYDVTNVRDIHPHAVYAAAKEAFRRFPKADGICLVAAVMRVADIIQAIEDDLGIPVVSNLTSRAWEVQKRLHIRQPIGGHGRLLSQLP